MRPMTFSMSIAALASHLAASRATHACTGPMFREFVAAGSAPPLAVPAITDVSVGALRGVFDARDTCGDLATRRMLPTPLDRVSVRVLRADSRPWVLCPEIPTVVLVLESDTRANLDGFGVRLVFFAGTFRLKSRPIRSPSGAGGK